MHNRSSITRYAYDLFSNSEKPRKKLIKQNDGHLGDENRFPVERPGCSGFKNIKRCHSDEPANIPTLSLLYLFIMFGLSFAAFICEFFSNLSTAQLFRKQNKFGESYATLLLTILPLTAINIFSFLAFLAGDSGHRISIVWIIRMGSHLSLLAVFQRRFETLCKNLRTSCTARSNMSDNLNAQTVKWRLEVIEENQNIAKLALIQSFLHDFPQLVLQSCIYNRTIFQNLEMDQREENEIQCADLCHAQLMSIFFSMMSLVLSIINYHDSKRLAMRNGLGKLKYHLLLYICQWFWLVGITGARVFAFSLAVANINFKIALTYLAIISFHWLVYTIYFKNQNEGKSVVFEVFSVQVPTAVQILLENARDWSLGIVHMFCCLDDFDTYDTAWKDRIEIKTFNYLIFGEDTMFLIVWYFKSTAHFPIEQRPWIWTYTAAFFGYYGFFIVGALGLRFYFKKLRTLSFLAQKRYEDQCS